MDLVARRRQASCGPSTAVPAGRMTWPGPLLWGLVAATLLIGFYLVVITLAQDWTHARDQLGADRWFVAAISAGFGVQVGLFVYLRSLHARSNPGAMAASSGTSSVAMLACCAHHLADALPLIGLSGAAVFLNDFKGPVLWTGIVMNGVGIAYLIWKIWQQRPHAGRLEIVLEAAPPHFEPVERS
jgi:hypothetical protein